MKIIATCTQCLLDGNVPFPQLVTVRGDGRYEHECSRGHHSVTISQLQLFEMLFEIGANAILDEYYREAVSSFSSAMERAFEFFLRAAYLERGGYELFLTTWKKMSSQSERQLGAFLVAYTTFVGESAPVLTDKLTQFRNSVVHKGEIPDRDNAVQYGQAVLDNIRTIINASEKLHPNGVRKTIFERIKQAREAGAPGTLQTTSSQSTIVSLTVKDPDQKLLSLEDALSRMMEVRFLFSK